MKTKKWIAAFACALFLVPWAIKAKTTTLVYLTPNTYVTSTHPDNYSADKYTGYLSIRGADRFVYGNIVAYPTWVRITYNVQGKITTKQVNSSGPYDATVRTGSVVVNDYWNIGPKTQVYGNFGYADSGLREYAIGKDIE